MKFDTLERRFIMGRSTRFSTGANKSGLGIGDASGVAEAIKLDPVAIAGKGRFAECSKHGSHWEGADPLGHRDGGFSLNYSRRPQQGL